MRAAAAAFAAERRTLQYYFKSTRLHDSVPRRCAPLLAQRVAERAPCNGSERPTSITAG